MILSDETMVLSLVLGVGLGVIYLINRAIVAVFGVKKWGVFLLDFTFAALCSVVTFIGALPIAGGRLRFVPMCFLLIGAVSVVFVFSPSKKQKNCIKKTKK